MTKQIQTEPIKPSRAEDLYKRLEIDRDASQEEIVAAYRMQALRWHPDRNPDKFEEAHREFIAVGEAFEVLSNPEKRSDYDKNQRVNSFRKRQKTPEDNPLKTAYDFPEYNFYSSIFKWVYGNLDIKKNKVGLSEIIENYNEFLFDSIINNSTKFKK